MEGVTTKYIVAEQPPWYFTSDYKDSFTCKRTQGLFDKVVDLMMSKQQALSDREKRYKPKTIYKIIRNMVIKDAITIQQQPSRSLLLALMDLVDIESGRCLESMADVDKAGLKHVILAYGNYRTFYIPTKELISTKGKKVIPVVTQYSDKHNFFYCDSSRSMIGTYTVLFLTKGKNNVKSYFIQEVLFVPGHESLVLLKSVTGNKFEFWDMALEVPTHSTALTPSFQQIQPVQLLRMEDKTMATQALVSRMEEIAPMCCVLSTAAEMVMTPRETRVDCFTDNEVICDLKHFHYENSGTRTVYFRRSCKVLDGKRVNLVPVVIRRKGQALAPQLYVSTTVRFCRAVKQSCVNGNGELVICWNDTLKDLERDTFTSGPDMYQEIHGPALAAFIKRVNPTSWCNYIPRHVESVIVDPIMVEVVELAIKLMDCKIPNAFPVAELLHCPLEKVRDHVKFWDMYASDNIVRTTVQKMRASMVERQMRNDWLELSHISFRYWEKRHGNDGTPDMAKAFEELFNQHTPNNIAKAQRMWHSLIKHDTSKIKDKELVQLYATAKVLFLKLRTYQNELKKYVKVREGELCNPNSASSSPHSTQVHDMSSKDPAGADECSEDDAVPGASETNDTVYSIVTPEPVPIATWIKNLPALLLSEPWLNGDCLRRDAVCTLLGLDKSLLDTRHRDTLADWVSNNRPVVNILQSYSLQDRLSKALVDGLKSLATDHWRSKVLRSFQGTRRQPRGDSEQPVATLSRSMKPGAERKKMDSGSTRIGKCAKNKMLFHQTKVARRDLSASKSNKASGTKSSGSKSETKLRYSRAHRPRPRYSGDDDDQPWLSQVEEDNSEEEECYLDEVNIPGEELEATKSYDDSEPLDEYDITDQFINDGSTGEEYSSEEEEDDDAFCAQVKNRAKLAKCKTKNANRGRRYKSQESHSESEKDARSPKPGCSGLKEEKSGYKRVLLSDSDNDSMMPEDKRVKRTKDNRSPHKRGSKLSRSDKVVKEKTLQLLGRKDKACAKKILDKSNKRCEAGQTAKKIPSRNRESNQYKNKLSESEEDDYEGEGNHWQGIKRGHCSKLKVTRSPVIDTDSEQEDICTLKKQQKGTLVNRSGENLENPVTERYPVQQKDSKGQQPGNRSGAKVPHRRSAVSQFKGPRLHVEAGKKAAKVTDQAAAWHADTTQQDCSDQKGDGEWVRDHEGLNREDHPTHPAEPTSAAESESQPEDDSESDFNDRLDKRPARTGCSDPVTDSGETDYYVSM